MAFHKLTRGGPGRFPNSLDLVSGSQPVFCNTNMERHSKNPWKGKKPAPNVPVPDPVPFSPPVFHPGEQLAEGKAYLEEHGYALYGPVLNAQEIEKAISLLWDFLESLGPPISFESYLFAVLMNRPQEPESPGATPPAGRRRIGFLMAERAFYTHTTSVSPNSCGISARIPPWQAFSPQFGTAGLKIFSQALMDVVS